MNNGAMCEFFKKFKLFSFPNRDNTVYICFCLFIVTHKNIYKQEEKISNVLLCFFGGDEWWWKKIEVYTTPKEKKKKNLQRKKSKK